MIVLIQFLVSGNNTECNILWKKETSLVFTRNNTKHEYTTTWEVVYFLSFALYFFENPEILLSRDGKKYAIQREQYLVMNQ